MFDISNPKKRERLLVIFAFLALVLIAIVLVPGQFAEAKKKGGQRDKYKEDIAKHQQTVRNKENIERRLTAFEGQALASGNSEALTRYQNWLRDLAESAGIRNPSGPAPVRSGGPQNNYTKYTFTLNGTANLAQIAEFLRRFHRTEYLHMIQIVQPRIITNQPGMYNVMFKIDALSLPQVSVVNIPSSARDATPTTEEEQQMLTDIRTRAILSEYTPPPPVRPPGGDEPPPPPPIPPFDEVRYHFVSSITESGGKPQCWVRNLLTERLYILSEGESFMLAYVPDEGTTLAQMRCTIKKIDAAAQQLLVELGGGLFTIKSGQNFDDIESVEEEPSPVVPKPETKEEEPETMPMTEPNEREEETEMLEPADEETEEIE